MTHKPPLPDDYALVDAVNGWVHVPDSNKNGHVWAAPDAEKTVGVFAHRDDRVYAVVSDDRATGLGRSVDIVRRDLDVGETLAEATAWGCDRAVAWMDRHAPTEWDHPDIVEAVFDPPVGFVLDRYYLEPREATVYYRQEGAKSGTDLAFADRRLEDDATLDTRPYLVVHVWRGSGNATIALAPWLRAHDEQMHEVVDPPAECGLDVAVKLAREWVAEQTGAERESLAAGQSDLEAWSA